MRTTKDTKNVGVKLIQNLHNGNWILLVLHTTGPLAIHKQELMHTQLFWVRLASLWHLSVSYYF